jgi:hypothetical protein
MSDNDDRFIDDDEEENHEGDDFYDINYSDYDDDYIEGKTEDDIIEESKRGEYVPNGSSASGCFGCLSVFVIVFVATCLVAAFS